MIKQSIRAGFRGGPGAGPHQKCARGGARWGGEVVPCPEEKARKRYPNALKMNNF